MAFALRYDGRKRVYTGHDFMARITAERLVEHLNRSGFVLMKAARGGALAPRDRHRGHEIDGGVRLSPLSWREIEARVGVRAATSRL